MMVLVSGFCMIWDASTVTWDVRVDFFLGVEIIVTYLSTWNDHV